MEGACVMHNNKIVTVFGGTGFLGRHIVKDLCDLGLTVKVATRAPEKAYFLKPLGNVGQVVPVFCNYSDANSVHEAVKGSDYVVNCIGILFERGKNSKFKKVHIDYPAMIAKACSDEHVSNFVHVSALGCDKGTSKYAKSKFEGEKAVAANYPDVTILRPSVMFGEDDNFINKFAELARYVPLMPLIGGGKTKFQPVFVGDIAEAVIKSCIDDSGKYKGRVFELGGLDVIDLKGIYEKIAKYTGREKKLISLPFSLVKFQTIFLRFMPKPFFLTSDQVESLKTDSIVDKGALCFEAFDITPKSMDLILPKYLEYYKSGGKFSKLEVA